MFPNLRLQAGIRCLNTWTHLTLSYEGSAPDIGAYESTEDCPTNSASGA